MSTFVLRGSKLPSKEDIRSFILQWNLKYPIDRWWRQKHGIVFNSPEHRVISFLDMYIEWMEDKLYKESLEKSLKNESYKSGDWLSENNNISYEEEVKLAENFDFSKLDDKDAGRC